MLREVLYLRISGQEQKSGISLSTQESILRKISEVEGEGKITEVYTDESKSAYLDDEELMTGHSSKEKEVVIRIPLKKRPRFNDMIEDAYKKKFDVVRVVKWDRLARVLELQEAIVRIFTRLGIEIKPATDPTNKIVRRILGTINEGESDKTSERINWAFDEKFRKNLFAKPFYGYDGIRDSPQGAITKFKINEEESKIIKEVFKSKINNEEKAWRRLGISERRYYLILKRKEYAGYLCRGKEEKYVPELEIIPLDLWKKANV